MCVCVCVPECDQQSFTLQNLDSEVEVLHARLDKLTAANREANAALADTKRRLEAKELVGLTD